jgi:hypothetical protein
VTGDGIAMVEVTMLAGVELDRSSIFHTQGNVVIHVNRLDHA